MAPQSQNIYYIPHYETYTKLWIAKRKVMDNQASLYGSVDIKTNPSSVSIWIDREEIGASHAIYNLLIPGNVKRFRAMRQLM
jgi:hypothetical protein